MATPKPPANSPPRAPDAAASTKSAQRDGPGGRIVHDERGNARWQVGGDTTHSDSTSRVLRSLELPDLQVEGQDESALPQSTRRADKPGQPKASEPNIPGRRQRAPMVDAGGGYNPYDLSVPVKKKPSR